MTAVRDHLVGLDEAIKQAIAKDAIKPIGEPSDDDLAIINSRHSRRTLTKSDVYVFENEISNNLIDSYFTQMDVKTTLKNYVRDFDAGLPLMRGHDTPKKLPVGRSFAAQLLSRGQVNNPDDPYRQAVVARTYIPRGMRIDGQDTDDIINGIDTGIFKDVSVQFRGALYECSVCGRDMATRDCTHTLGRADAASKKVATATLRNASAVEHSLVFKGSTPQAMVAKARALESCGLLCSDAAEACIRAAGGLTRGNCPKCGGKIGPQSGQCESCGYNADPQLSQLDQPRPEPRPAKPEKPTSVQTALDTAGVERDTIVMADACPVCGLAGAVKAGFCPRCGWERPARALPRRQDGTLDVIALWQWANTPQGGNQMNSDLVILNAELKDGIDVALGRGAHALARVDQAVVVAQSTSKVKEQPYALQTPEESQGEVMELLSLLSQFQATPLDNRPSLRPLIVQLKALGLKEGSLGASHTPLGSPPNPAGIVQNQYGPDTNSLQGQVGRADGAHEVFAEHRQAVRSLQTRRRGTVQKIRALPT